MKRCSQFILAHSLAGIAALLGAGLIFIGRLPQAQAALVTLQEGTNGYTGTQDTSLIQNFSANNYGGRTDILVGPTGAGQARTGIIRFDVSGISGQYSLVNSATLKLTVDLTSANATFNVYRMAEANIGWVEGTANGTSQSGSSSWSDRIYSTVPWAGSAGAETSGTDFFSSSMGSASVSTGTTPVGTVVSWNLVPSPFTLTNMFDTWDNTSLNAGMQIRRTGATAQWGFSSKDNATVADRPILEFSATGTINWNVAGSGAWDTSTSNWKMGTLVPSVIYENADTVNFANTAGGTITVAGGGVTPGGVNVSATSGTYTFTGGAIGGAGNLTKSGGGTLTVANNNTYSGTTTISGGTLALNGTHTGGGTYTVASGGRLQGSGGADADLVVLAGGTVAPGNSIESLGVGAILINGGTFEYEINSTLLAADLLYGTDSNSPLTLLGSPILTLVDLGSGSVPVGTKFTLIAYDGAWNGGVFTGYPDDSLIYGFGGINWWINYNDSSSGSNFGGDATAFGTNFVTITATAVPEPSSYALGLVGLVALACRAWAGRRKRQLRIVD